MKVGEIEYEKFVEIASEHGVSEVTPTEWEKHAKGKEWTVNTAIIRIKNERKGLGIPKREVWEGYPLGGRDFTYRGIDIEDARSQFISFLRKDGELLELTCFGHFKGKHNYKSEIEIETVTKQGKTVETTFVNHNIRSVTVFDDKLSIKKLIDKAIPVGMITEDMLYKTVAVYGYISDQIEKIPIFSDDGEIIDDYNTYFNSMPCFQFMLKGENQWVRVKLSPTKHAEHYTNIEDLGVICKNNDLGELISSLAGRGVVVVGCVRNISEGQDGYTFVTIDATAVIETEIPELVEEGEEIEETEITESAEEKEARNIVAELKQNIRDAYAVLGDSITVQSVRELGIGEGISDTILEKVIEKVRSEESGEGQSR